MSLHRKLERPARRVQGLAERRCCSARATSPTPASSPRSPGAARSSSPTSSTTRASSTAAGSPRAETFVYRHRDIEHLEWGLREAGDRARLIVTDGVFSMDGDVAPLAELVELARRHRCLLAVDEAHGTGALGPGGRGAVAAAGLSGEVDVVDRHARQGARQLRRLRLRLAELIELLVNTARPFIYSTAPPPPSVGAALAALACSTQRPGMVEQLRRNARDAARGARRAGPRPRARSRTQIVPLIVGDARRAMALCERMLRGRRVRPGDPPADRARRAARGCG